MLDSNVLSLLCHPNKALPDIRDCLTWLGAQLSGGAEVYLPEIAYYEQLREYLRIGSISVTHLKILKTTLRYVPLDTPMIERAAELWASAWNKKLPTADKHARDGDVILAAQAEAVGAILVTENVKHLSRYVTTERWRNLPP